MVTSKIFFDFASVIKILLIINLPLIYPLRAMMEIEDTYDGRSSVSHIMPSDNNNDSNIAARHNSIEDIQESFHLRRAKKTDIDLKKTAISSLDLSGNEIDESEAELLSYNTTLTALDLCFNNIGYSGAGALSRNTSLTSLNLNSNKIGERGAKALSRSVSIVALGLRSNNIGDLGAEALSYSKKLTFADLRNNDIRRFGAEALSRLSTLTAVDLDGNKISDEGVEALSHNKTLLTLSLANTGIGTSGVEALSRNTSLTYLDLSSNNLGDTSAKILGQNRALLSLCLSWNNISDIGFTSVIFIPTITSLDLSNNKISKLESGALNHKTTLTYIDLSGNNIGEAGAEVLSYNSFLTSLDLDSCGISDIGATALSYNRSLTSLGLAWNMITDIGVKALNHIPTLRSLDLYYNFITDVGAEILSYNATLTSLNLSANKTWVPETNHTIYNNISDKAAVGLSRNTTLTRLDLSSNSISDLGAEALRRNQKLTFLNIKDQNSTACSTLSARKKLKQELYAKYNFYRIGDELREAIEQRNRRLRAQSAESGNAYAVASLIEETANRRLEENTKNNQLGYKYINKAAKSYQKAAEHGNLEAQKNLKILHDGGLYESLDEEMMSIYKSLITKVHGSFGYFLSKFNDQAYRLKLSQLIFMDLESQKAPSCIEWGGSYSPSKRNYIYKPLYVSTPYLEFEDAIMAIDPSGESKKSNKDETAYCVAKRLGNYYFIMDVGGHGGGYEKKEIIKGNDDAILSKLGSLAVLHKVRRISVEKNFDNSYADLLVKHLKEMKIEGIEIEKHSSEENKEQRIISIIESLLEKHCVIMDRWALEKDFESNPQDNITYKFFAQLIGITSDKSKWASSKSSLKHDDRLDAVAMAIKLLMERKGEN